MIWQSVLNAWRRWVLQSLPRGSGYILGPTFNQTTDTPSLAFTCVYRSLERVRGESLRPSQDFPEPLPSLIRPGHLPDAQEYVKRFSKHLWYLIPSFSFYVFLVNLILLQLLSTTLGSVEVKHLLLIVFSVPPGEKSFSFFFSLGKHWVRSKRASFL